MRQYTDFAYVYDELMDNVPYDDWAKYLISLLKEYGTEKGLLCELGCGTGKITRRLFDAGYDMIGIDMSEEMLDVARENSYEEIYGEKASKERSILYLEQDMREMELFGTVDAVVSLCDSMNYLTEDGDLEKVFKLVNNYLEPSGLFIFDMNTEYKYEKILSDNVIAENRDDCSLIWENDYDSKTKINEYDITIYVKEDDEDEDMFRRFEESHFQRAYSVEEVIEKGEKAGMEFVCVYDAFTHNAPKENSERVYFIFREKYQEGKYYDK